MKVANMLPQQGAKRVKVVEVLYTYTRQRARHSHACARANAHTSQRTRGRRKTGDICRTVLPPIRQNLEKDTVQCRKRETTNLFLQNVHH